LLANIHEKGKEIFAWGRGHLARGTPQYSSGNAGETPALPGFRELLPLLK